MINIDKLYDLMADKGFQEPDTGNLFFPAYIYTYQPEQEYEIREQLLLLSQKLKRPNNFLDCMVINIYHEFIDYLKNKAFTGTSLFELIIEKEKEDAEEAFAWIRDEISDGDFFNYLENKINDYFNPAEEKRVYLIIYGVGSIFPYLRASEFLKKTERLIKQFKILLFYPGTYNHAKYSLFGLLDDDHMYRANNLNILLGE
jgi:hypothetical protein